MTVHVGIDLASVDEVAESVATFGHRYLARVYTERELADCTGRTGVDPARLAARFAAKEAVMKALGAGEGPWPWTTIEVVRARGGSVEIGLSGTAAEQAADEGIGALTVSLAHAGNHVGAVVLATAAPRRTT